MNYIEGKLNKIIEKIYYSGITNDDFKVIVNNNIKKPSIEVQILNNAKFLSELRTWIQSELDELNSSLQELADKEQLDIDNLIEITDNLNTKIEEETARAINREDELEDLIEQSFSDFNIENGVGTKALQQKQDGTGGTFDFTGKNPNATAIDPTLTGNIPYGGVGAFSSSFGGKSSAQGKRSFAEGTTTIAKGNYSHAEGDNSVSIGNDSHAEGYQTVSQGQASHSEGNSTIAQAYSSHAEGFGTKSKGDASHAEGWRTEAGGLYSHSEGAGTKANATYSHSEGRETIATGGASHSEGSRSYSTGVASHAEGSNTTAAGEASHAEGKATIAGGDASHAEGSQTAAYSGGSHAEGGNTFAHKLYSHAEGNGTEAGLIINDFDRSSMDSGSPTPPTPPSQEGIRCVLKDTLTSFSLAGFTGGEISFQTEGNTSVTYHYLVGDSATGTVNYQEASTWAGGRSVRAYQNGAWRDNSYKVIYVLEASPDFETWVNENSADGSPPLMTGAATHAEGSNTKAVGVNSHAEGSYTKANGNTSHASGYLTEANGALSEAHGKYTTADGYAQFVVGQYNIPISGYDASFIVGIGQSKTNLKNGLIVHTTGSVEGLGIVRNNTDLTHKQYVDESISLATGLATENEVLALIPNI